MEENLFTFAFYNTENFYSKINENETSFLPSNFLKWEDSRYDLKVDKIAFAISKIGFKETNNLPVFVGLSEVENSSVLKDLLNNNYLKSGNYDFILYESLDERKINVGCIFRKDFIEIIESEPIRIVFKNQNDERSYTRDILYIKVKFKEEIIYFFVVHLPSKIDKEINQSKRLILLQKIKTKIDNILEKGNNPKIVLMGDFNDSPTSDHIRETLNSSPAIESLKIFELFNPMVRLLNYKRGSLIHKKQWMLFDQMLFSKGFIVENSKINWVNTEIFDESFLTTGEGKYGRFPFRTFIGSKYLGGYSDHFPIYTIIKC